LFGKQAADDEEGDQPRKIDWKYAQHPAQKKTTPPIFCSDFPAICFRLDIRKGRRTGLHPPSSTRRPAGGRGLFRAGLRAVDMRSSANKAPRRSPVLELHPTPVSGTPKRRQNSFGGNYDIFSREDDKLRGSRAASSCRQPAWMPPRQGYDGISDRDSRRRTGRYAKTAPCLRAHPP
jgi:hypothetical protein